MKTGDLGRYYMKIDQSGEIAVTYLMTDMVPRHHG